MKYRVEYWANGAENGFVGLETLDAENNDEAKSKAKKVVENAQNTCNQEIENRFWHYDFKLTGLSRIIQQEISESVLL